MWALSHSFLVRDAGSEEHCLVRLALSIDIGVLHSNIPVRLGIHGLW